MVREIRNLELNFLNLNPDSNATFKYFNLSPQIQLQEEALEAHQDKALSALPLLRHELPEFAVRFSEVCCSVSRAGITV